MARTGSLRHARLIAAASVVAGAGLLGACGNDAGDQRVATASVVANDSRDRTSTAAKPDAMSPAPDDSSEVPSHVVYSPSDASDGNRGLTPRDAGRGDSAPFTDSTSGVHLCYFELCDGLTWSSDETCPETPPVLGSPCPYEVGPGSCFYCDAGQELIPVYVVAPVYYCSQYTWVVGSAENHCQ